jgi:hypothetical protein
MGPRGWNGANGNEMHIIFLYGPRLLRRAMAHGPLVSKCTKMNMRQCFGPGVHAKICIRYVTVPKFLVLQYLMKSICLLQIQQENPDQRKKMEKVM